MKKIITILIILAVAGILNAITGIQKIHFSNASTVITHETILGRLLALGFGIVSLIAANGCRERRIYAWYIVNIMLWIAVLWETAVAIYALVTWHLDWLADILGVLGESFKIGVGAWVIFHFWAKQRNEFLVPNQSTDPAA